MDTTRRWWIPVVIGTLIVVTVLTAARALTPEEPLRAAPVEPATTQPPSPAAVEAAEVEPTPSPTPSPRPSPTPSPTPDPDPTQQPPQSPTIVVRPRIVVVAPRPKVVVKPSVAPQQRPSAPASQAPKRVAKPLPKPVAKPLPRPVARTRIDKIMIVIFENHGYWSVRKGMPFVWAVAQRYAHANNFFAVHQDGSLPNYIALVGGGMWLDHNTARADDAPVRGKPTVFGQAIRAGRTAKTYAEAMSGTCDLSKHGMYKVHHNPWAYFVAERSLCRRYDVSYERHFANDVRRGALPNLSLVVPHNCDNAHEPCSLGAADRWFRTHMQRVWSGPDWRSGRLLVVQTWDEDNRGDEHNRILTAFIHPSLRHQVVSKRLDLYSLSKLASQITGTAPLYHARTAPPIVGPDGLRLTPLPARVAPAPSRPVPR